MELEYQDQLANLPWADDIKINNKFLKHNYNKENDQILCTTTETAIVYYYYHTFGCPIYIHIYI